MRRLIQTVAGVALLLSACAAHAGLTVLVGEPFGRFGTMMPNGHVAIYLDRVCADGPTKLRMCEPGEAAGVAVARLDAIGSVDWVASPILPFLYATSDSSQILTETNTSNVGALRERYRAAALETLLPDGSEFEKRNSDWWELAGAAYNRRLWGYQIDTTREQDEAFVAHLNAAPNRHVYAVGSRNCADFAADVVNFYYPKTVRRDHFSDMGIMSPKQVAKSVYRYGTAHPEAELKVIEIPQVPGTLRRSRPVRGGAEGFLKTKRYLLTLCVIQPEAVLGLLAVYLEDGRWKLGAGAEVLSASMFEGSSAPLATK